MSTREQAKIEFFEIATSRGFSVVGDYINATTKVMMRCPEGHEWPTGPNNFKKGYGCPKCAGKCQDTIRQEFFDSIVVRGYTLIGEYENNRTKVLMKCPEGHEISIAPSSLRNGRRCPKCAGKCPEQAKEDLFRISKERGFSVVGKYINNHTKVLMKCPEGHEVSILPSSFKSGSGCLKCAGQCPEQAKESFIKLANERDFIIIGEYVNSNTKVLMKCPVGHEWVTRPTTLKKGIGCPKCSGHCPEQAKEDLVSTANKRGFSVVGKYINNHTKVRMKCPVGHEWSVVPSNFKMGQGCPKCAGHCSEQSRDNFFTCVESRGYKILGKHVDNRTKVLMKCPEGHEFSMPPLNFKMGQGCPKCAGQCPEQARDNFFSIARDRGFSVVGKYINNHTKVLMKCCQGHEFHTIPGNFKMGQGCPSCTVYGFKPDKSAYFYLTTWSLEGYDVLKFGITNHSPKKRFVDQSRGTEYNVKSHVHLKFVSGLHAIWLEKIVKRYQKEYGSALSKEEFPDGFTETIDYSHYANVMGIINDYVGGLVDHGIEVEWG